MAPAIGDLLSKSFSIARAPSIEFSGTNGQIDMTAFKNTKITESGALRVAAIYIATTLLADEIASLTWRTLRKNDKQRIPIEHPKLPAIWGSPNPDQTQFGIRVTETLSLMIWGRSFGMNGWTRDGTLDVRWPIDPARASLIRLDNGLRLKVTGQGELDNIEGKLPEFTFHALYQLPGQLNPVSPVEMASELAGLASSYQEVRTKLASTGLAPAAVLTVGEKVEPLEAAELSQRISRIHGGSSNAGKIAVVGGPGIKLETLSMSMADAEMVATNDQVFSILMAMWRVPPTVAGLVDKPSTWGTGVAEFSRGLERFTLRPIVQRLQEGYEKYNLKPVDPALQYRAKFDSLMSADPKMRAEVQRLGLQAGMTSIERVLAQNDEPPFTDEESTFSQLALATVEDRRLNHIKLQAQTYRELINAGVTPEDASRVTGLDVENIGLPPASLQYDLDTNDDGETDEGQEGRARDGV